MAALILAALSAGLPAASAAPSGTITLHPGQSKKVGRYTVSCATGAGKRTKTRIGLAVGFQVKVNGTLVKCAAATATTPTPTPTPPPPQQGSRNNPFPIGTAGTAPGSSIFTPGASWTVAVNTVNPNAWPAVEAANEFNDPPPAGSVDFLVNLTVTLNGTASTDITSFTAFLSAVGSSGIGYDVSQDCGVLPSPAEIDYSDIFPGATFTLNYCWQVSQSDVSSLDMYWSAGDSPGPFWALH